MGKGYSHGAPHQRENLKMEHEHGTSNPHPASASAPSAQSQLGAQVKSKPPVTRSAKTQAE